MINYNYIPKKHRKTLSKLSAKYWSSIQNINNSRLRTWKNKGITSLPLINLIKQPNDNDCNIIDKIYLYFKDPHEVRTSILH